MRAKTYQAVGRCIYCGSAVWSAGEDRKLGDEHIVPEGLGGKLVLPESSCRSCEAITSRIEIEWLRGSYYAARVQQGLEKKKKRPQRHLPLKIDINGQSVQKFVPIQEYPGLIVTLLFDQPEILLDIEPSTKKLTGGVAVGTLPGFGNKLNSYLSQGSVSFVPPRKSADSSFLGRMLAKIGHSYAVAELGIGGFEALLQPIILGSDLQDLAQYVGGSREIPNAINDPYEVDLKAVRSKGGREFFMVVIRLLSNTQGMPEYRVVVGRPKATSV